MRRRDKIIRANDTFFFSLPGAGQCYFNYSYAKSGGHVSYQKTFNTRSFFFFIIQTRELQNFYALLKILEKITSNRYFIQSWWKFSKRKKQVENGEM